MAQNTITKQEIVRDLEALGIRNGCKLLVHSAMSSMGHVEGGAESFIDALLEVVGMTGTVLVPTLTGDHRLSVDNPPVFDVGKTPCWTGTIPETFRNRRAARRSLHPTHSVAAIGHNAEALTADHVLSVTPCDEQSPYGKLTQDSDGYILLLGVSHEANTTFHWVEEYVGVDYHIQPGFARATIIVGDKKSYKHVMLHRYGSPRNFNIMEPVFNELGIQKTGTIGSATAKLVHAKRMFEATVSCLRNDQGLLIGTS